jgi:hypothetical protein
MLIERLRAKDHEGIMYHYCSAQTFLSILQNRTIRFSYVNLLNDAEEASWGYAIFQEAVELLSKREGRFKNAPEMPTEFFEALHRGWVSSELALANFVACFSNDGDSLSQWRAYADDGGGFSIGFKTKELRRTPVQILDVLYDREQQLAEMTGVIGATFLEFQDADHEFDGSWLSQRSMEIAASSIAFKNPAWRDEREVRCHHLVNSSIDEGGWRLIDEGGMSDDIKVSGQPIQFQARNGTIVPFFDMPFEVSRDHQPIQEVIMGPKCANAPEAVMYALGNLGYGNIPLKMAGVKYR